MSLILSLETSAKICSAAIHEGDRIIASHEVHIEQSHASRLAIIIDNIKDVAGVKLNQLSAVAVSSGPGSYTGLRIGTSTAKGLCYALGIPLIAVGSLELLAYQMKDRNPENSFLCPMIDARRMEVYCLITNSSLKVVHATEAKVIDEVSFKEYLDQNTVIFFGDGSAKCRNVIMHENARFVDGIYPRASFLGLLADEKLKKNEVEDVVNFEPHYLKEFMIKTAKSV